MEKSEDRMELARMYKINAYPILIFIDSEDNTLKILLNFKKAGGQFN